MRESLNIVFEANLKTQSEGDLSDSSEDEQEMPALSTDSSQTEFAVEDTFSTISMKNLAKARRSHSVGKLTRASSDQLDLRGQASSKPPRMRQSE